ncbi:MAG: BMP family ABC transporter substrate-binding protein, partial [Oscillospiraceae bacterium]|nr:BMP family ABC transporter substrate-binding protein [Oscillospiraceae bacterium]
MALVLCMMFAMCATASAADAKIKVGMVTDVGGVNDKSFNQLAWEGLQALDPDAFEVNYLESKTDADYQTNINTFIDEEYDLIITVGYMLADATREAAMDNPDQKFAIVDDSSCADLENVACLMFAQEECSYLVGLVAGSVTKSHTVGYVQGMVSDPMNLFGIGYITGVLEACPEATVLQYNANNFGDIAGGNTAAKDMITKGADVIYHAAGGTGNGVMNACDEAGIYGIGVDKDQRVELGLECIITSAMKRVDVACQDISKAVKDDAFKGGVHLYNLANDGVGIAPTTDVVPAETLEKVEAAKKAIIAGEKTIPTTAADCPAFTLNG